MNQVGLARSALLAAVFARGEQISTAQQIKISLRMIAPDLVANFFDTDHKRTVFELWSLDFEIAAIDRHSQDQRSKSKDRLIITRLGDA